MERLDGGMTDIEERDEYQVRVYSTMVLFEAGATFGDLREMMYVGDADVPVGAVHKEGERRLVDDEAVVVEELGRPPGGWVVVFEEPPLEDYSTYRYGRSDE